VTIGFATGDLFTPDEWKHQPSDFEVHRTDAPVDAIGHGVNCFGAMGSGIAVAFRQKFPEMYEKYKLMCDEAFLKPGMVYPWLDRTHFDGQNLFIFNIASQFRPGADANLDYLESGLLYCRFYMRQRGLKHLALPRIGAGIGGLEWDDVVFVAEDVFAWQPDLHLTLVSLEGA
jgi:O-acetyl-ADP-ribose deacetylase (regulator of RNase III)